MSQAERDLRALNRRIQEQIRAAKRRQHGRLLAVLIDCEAVAKHYATLAHELVQECV
jgi:hypothetical protein